MNAPQDSATHSPNPDDERPHLQAPASFVGRFVRRLIGGVLFILPIAITAFIVYYVYHLLNRVIEPVVKWIIFIRPNVDNAYWNAAEAYVVPPITLLAVVFFLYAMGYLFQTRLNRWIDWLFQRIPGISTVYQAIRDVSAAVQGPHGLKNIDTVVLVPFPHQHARMAGYLMGEVENTADGERLVCVYIPIGIFPPSGYTLIFPHEQVTLTDWRATEVWKMLLSGGLTVPPQVPFERRTTERQAG